MIDRLSIRARPEGRPVMYQSWGKLLFMHWPIEAAQLQPLLPDCLHLDLYEGTAWIGVIPFTMWGIRPAFLPALPGLSTSHELNVRTYVHAEGVPGVWFLSLDATNRLAVWAARLTYHLPYFRARMALEMEDRTIHYTSERTQRGAPSATFEATWTVDDEPVPARLNSLDFFLTERYCLYATHKDRLYRARIHHPPWPLRTAHLQSFSSTMIAAHGLPSPEGSPLLHYAEAVDVAVWPLRDVL